MAATAKSFDFPVSVRWLSGRRALASVEGKQDLEVAAPPEFRGGVEGVWSPEDLFVSAVAACYAVTLVALAERRAVPLRSLEVGASGRVTQRDDGRFGFTRVGLDVLLVTDQGFEEEAVGVAEAAERSCLVSASLDLATQLDLKVDTAPLVSSLP